MGKAPAFQFYPNDWTRDLEEHPLEIEGAWIRICCKLWWSETRGKLTRTVEQWAKILRVEEDKAVEILEYIQKQKIGNIPETFDPIGVTGNELVTVVSRRMVKDEKERSSTKLRVQRYRERQASNAPVTDDVTVLLQRSSSSSSSSCTKVHNKEGTKVPLSSSEDNHIPYREIIQHLNEKTNLHYRPTTKQTKTLIRARWNEGFRLADFLIVIDKMSAAWGSDSRMMPYLRPVTLFGTKFEGYLNRPESQESTEEPF